MRSNLVIAIPCYNLKEDTLACIRSLQRAGADPKQIIVIDNGSTDGVQEALAAEFGSQIAVIANPENLGVAQAFSQGLSAAMQRGAEWALILNNDTEAAEDFFAQIDLILAQDLPYRIYAPAILYHSDPQVVWHLGAARLPGTLIWRNRWQGRRYDPAWPPVLATDSISGCAMLIHRQVYERIGLFDQRLFAYWEEVDYLWRASRAGFSQAVITHARLWHKVARTAGREPARRRYLRVRNQLHFYRTYARGPQRAIIYVFMTRTRLPGAVIDGLAGRAALSRAAWEGLRDGWHGF